MYNCRSDLVKALEETIVDAGDDESSGSNVDRIRMLILKHGMPAENDDDRRSREVEVGLCIFTIDAMSGGRTNTIYHM